MHIDHDIVIVHDPHAAAKQSIDLDDLEYEVEDRFTSDVRIYRFHFSCHAAWQFECAHQEHMIKAR
jgi:hypothetical protein